MYIRTKDEILKVFDFEYMCGVKMYHTNKGMITEELVLKEDNEIDELCNEFTYEYCRYSKHERCWKDSNTGIWYDYDTDIALNKKEILTIKGAIWCDKGLIYVAKMNEDGNLELI